MKFVKCSDNFFFAKLSSRLKLYCYWNWFLSDACGNNVKAIKRVLVYQQTLWFSSRLIKDMICLLQSF